MPVPCSLGQNLAKLELQVVLATLLSRFRFSPGPELQAAVEVAQHTGLSPIAAVYDCAEVHVTLQPAGGQMLLRVEQR
jgi:pheromone shutdown protein TraB